MFFLGCQDSWTCEECVSEECFFIKEKSGSTFCISDLQSVDKAKIEVVVYPGCPTDCPEPPQPIPPLPPTTTSTTTTTFWTTNPPGPTTTFSPEPFEAPLITSLVIGMFTTNY